MYDEWDSRPGPGVHMQVCRQAEEEARRACVPVCTEGQGATQHAEGTPLGFVYTRMSLRYSKIISTRPVRFHCTAGEQPSRQVSTEQMNGSLQRPTCSICLVKCPHHWLVAVG